MVNAIVLLGALGALVVAAVVGLILFLVPPNDGPDLGEPVRIENESPALPPPNSPSPSPTDPSPSPSGGQTVSPLPPETPDDDDDDDNDDADDNDADDTGRND